MTAFWRLIFSFPIESRKRIGKIIEESRARRERERAEAKKAIEEKEKEVHDREAGMSILDYPIVIMTEEEVAKLPKSGIMPADFLEGCPVGIWFLCKPNRFLPNIVVVGQVVGGDDLRCSQWGAGLPVSSRGVNHYKVWFF